MLKTLHSDGCEVAALAKLNLFLEILGKRSDGYHELETLMIRISLHDTLRFRFTATRAITLRNHWSGGSDAGHASRVDLPIGSQNLVIKAAELLARTTGCSQGAEIDLFKRIPLAAGLAGGSSDCAATLIGLNQLWDLKLSRTDLMELGAKLGSDVPFFLADTIAAVCRGRGEIIEPVTLGSTLHFVVAKPDVGLSTAQVFQHCKPSRVSQSVTEMVQSLQCGNLRRIGSHFLNRLGDPAIRLCPQVEQLSKEFARLPVSGHQMSGSGTSYFGLCSHREQALHLKGRLGERGLGSIFAVQSCV
jgi:4-diphosphocytidyl-2-C-methyl-D-erythritol kinase